MPTWLVSSLMCSVETMSHRNWRPQHWWTSALGTIGTVVGAKGVIVAPKAVNAQPTRLPLLQVRATASAVPVWTIQRNSPSPRTYATKSIP